MDTPPLPPTPPPRPPPPPPPPAAPVKNSNRVLIIVLCILGGILLIIGGCVTTCAYFVHKGVKEAQRNPQLAAENMTKAMEQFAKGLKSAAPAKPTAEHAAEPSPAESETPPEETKPAEDSISPARAAAQAATMKKFPDFVAVYPGAKALDTTLNSFGGNSIGNYTFTTGDAPDTVADFYEKKLTTAGFSILTKESGSNDNGATASMVANRANPQIAITFSAEVESGKTRVAVGFTRVGGN